ncbi:MAG: rubrerythrin family protein [Acidobacteriota bacterium]
MRKMTEQNLRAAFAGESQAHMKYLIFAGKAEKEGNRNVGRLFRAIAFAEQVHATNHLKALGEVGSTTENLQTAINGETYEVDEMYPVFYETAKFQEEKLAQRSTNWALEAEKIHAAMYSRAKQSLEEGKDLSPVSIYICDVCGYTVEGTAPDKCPLCNASMDRFVKF